MTPLEADLILAALRRRAPHEWVEMVEAVNRDSPTLEVIKAVLAGCLLAGDEVGLIGELAALDRLVAHLAYERARQVTTSAGANRNETRDDD